MSEVVHFPSDRVGFTWCGLALDILPEMDISDGAQRSANGLLFATNMPVVTCRGCQTEQPAPDPIAVRVLCDGTFPPMPAVEQRIIGSAHYPTFWQAFVPLVATLPDGTQISLPAGTVLRSQ